jgi:hypothetical protein
MMTATGRRSGCNATVQNLSTDCSDATQAIIAIFILLRRTSLAASLDHTNGHSFNDRLLLQLFITYHF